jgi:hypothetical protein
MMWTPKLSPLLTVEIKDADEARSVSSTKPLSSSPRGFPAPSRSRFRGWPEARRESSEPRA